MKKLLLVLLLVGNCCIAFCKDNVKLYGNIKHPLSDTIKVSYAPTSIAYEPKDFFATLDKSGSFHISLSVPEGYTNLSITNGTETTEIFVMPGAYLSLFVDGHNFDSSVRYKGKGEEIANFMAKHVLERHIMLHFGYEGQMLSNKEPADYERALKELADKDINFLQQNGGNLPESFKEYFRIHYRYKVYATMEMYPRVHEMFRQKSNRVNKIPKENYVVIDHIPQEFNDNYIDIEAYQEYLYNFFALKMARDMAFANISDDAQQPSADTFLTLAYTKMPPKTAEFFAGHTIYVHTKYTPLDKLLAEYETYKAHFPNSANLGILEQSIALKKTLAIGKPAVDFNIETPEGTNMKLSDLKGNIVYLDFWSRGCVPCITEMPDAKKVREYFKDKPVKFVYISIDPDDNTWKKAIKDFEVDGINTRVNGQWQSELVKSYGVKSIPSYFLIDKEGNFAAIEDVARPSNYEKLKKQVETLLK